MKNREFHFLLRKLKDPAGRRWTVGRIAATIYVSRPRLNDVLNNKPGQGGQTRVKVVRFLEDRLPDQRVALLAALGWDEAGNVNPAPSGTEASPLRCST